MRSEVLASSTLAILVAWALIGISCGGSSSSHESTRGDDAAVEAEPSADPSAAPTAIVAFEPTAVPAPTATAAAEPSPTPTADSDGDGELDHNDDDDDNDGVEDDADLFPFNPYRSAPLAPIGTVTNGVPDLAPGALADAVAWILSEWQPTETTELDEVQDRFDPAFLAQFGAEGIADFMNGVRTSWSGAEFTEIVNLDRYRMLALWQSPGGVVGQVRVHVKPDGSDKIAALGVRNYVPAELVAPEYVSLNQDEVLQQLIEQNAEVSVLVARIEDNECVGLLEQAANDPKPTASIFKGWVLGAAADEVGAGRLSLDQIMVVEDRLRNVSGTTIQEPAGTELTMLEMATLMMSVSDNTATDHMIEIVGDEAVDGAAARFGHSEPELMSPMLRTNELFNMRLKVGSAAVADYLAMTDSEQRVYANEVLDPLPPFFSPPVFETVDSVLTDVSWQANTYDICTLMAGLRQYPDTSDSMRLIDAAYGASAPLIVAPNWGRAWFKGGSLAVDASGPFVLTLGYLLEDDERGTYVVTVMAETAPGTVLDQRAISGLTQRLLLLVDEGTFE